MQDHKQIATLKTALTAAQEAGNTIGFVPTMGALHDGHISLIRTARQACDIVVVSLFVNPTQFNDPYDYQTYPRTPEADARILVSEGVDYSFSPAEEEIYPEPDTRIFDLGPVGQVMEGVERPGHFNGVCQVVSRLFDIICPDKAFFGEKDIQQIAVIQRMCDLIGSPVKIIPCPIVREIDGLAKSSRNTLLSAEERLAAPRIREAMVAAVAEMANFSPTDVSARLIDKLNSLPHLKVEYFRIVNAHTMQVEHCWNQAEEIIGCITCYCGKVRLIDNIRFK